MSEVTAWPSGTLDEFDRMEELNLVLTREGYSDLRLPIWVVVVDGHTYVRSYLGATSGWFRRVQLEFDQTVVLAAGETPVHFANIDRLAHVNKAIDAAFDRKYSTFDYVSAMSEPAAVEATLRIDPRA